MRRITDLMPAKVAPYITDIGADINSLGQTRQFLDRTVSDATERLAASKLIQEKYVGRDLARDLLRGNEGVQRTLVDALKDINIDDLQDISKRDAIRYGRDYAAQADDPISLRSLYQMGEQAIIDNPKTAMAVGTGAAGAGGIAAITASGAGLNALANFIAGGQQTQENRDNVLRS